MDLIYGDGKVNLDNKNNVVGLQISYIGNNLLKQVLSENFILYKNKKTIIIYSLNLETIPSLLFEYEGSFKITRCIAGDRNGTKIKIYIKNNSLDYYNKMSFLYEKADVNWHLLDKNYIVKKEYREQQDILPNLSDEQIKIVKKFKKNRS